MVTFTTDTFFNGRIQVRQERGGYRYSIDAIILAYQAGQAPGRQVLDLGTGCGIIPMIMAFRNPDLRIFGVEVQPALAELASDNVRTNGMADRVSILHQDMKSLSAGMADGPVDLVVANPPFYRLHTGRINPNGQRAVARHEIKANLSDVLSVGSRMVRTGGRFLAIYPVERLCDMMTEMRRARIEPKMLRMIQSGAGLAAKLVLIEGIKGGKSGITVPPPLIIYNSGGSYTTEVNQMFQA